jgi:hypothetical protein
MRSLLSRLFPGGQKDRKGRHPSYRDDSKRRLQQFLVASAGPQRSGDVHSRRLAFLLAGVAGIPLPGVIAEYKYGPYIFKLPLLSDTPLRWHG